MSEFSFYKVWIIAKREYLERVKTRSFILATFATPVLMGVFLLLPALISASTARNIMRESERARVVIASDNRALAELAAGELTRQPGTHYDSSVVSPTSPDERAQLDRQLDAGEIEGYVWLDAPALASRHVVFRTSHAGDFIVQRRRSLAHTFLQFIVQGAQSGQNPNDHKEKRK